MTDTDQEVASRRRAQAALDVIDHVHEAFCDHATSFSCGEIEMIAELYRAWGHDDMADSIIRSHADGDDEGDDHYGQGGET